MKTSPVQHVHVQREDGSVVLFPVSKHVLSFKESVAHTAPETAPKRSLFSWRRRAQVGALAFVFAATSLSVSQLSIGTTLAYLPTLNAL